MAKAVKASVNDTLTIVNNHIKDKTFSRVYLMFGAEFFLVSQYKNKLRDALISEDDNLNYSLYKDSKFSVEELINSAETMPFFAEKRVIMVEDSGYFQNGNEKFQAYMSSIPESTCIIFVEHDVDKRTAMYKAVVKNGTALEFNTPDEKDLVIWTAANFRRDQYQVEERAVYQLIQSCASDMTALSNEIEKLKGFRADTRQVTAADVDLLCVSQIENKVFALTEAIARKQREQSIKLYNDLILLREPAMKIIALINRHYTKLVQIKRLLDENRQYNDIASIAEVPPFSIKNYASQCSFYTYEQLIDYVDACQSYDTKIKTGQLTDKEALMMMILNFIQ